MAIGRKTGGRVKGVPNKATRDVRAAIAAFASANVEKMETWLEGIKDPARKLELFLRVIEYNIPKLQRLTVDPESKAIGGITFNLKIHPPPTQAGKWCRG